MICGLLIFYILLEKYYTNSGLFNMTKYLLIIIYLKKIMIFQMNIFFNFINILNIYIP